MAEFAFIIWTSILITIVIHDYKTFLIPDWLNIACAIASIFFAHSLGYSKEHTAVGMAAGFALPASINLLFRYTKKLQAIGTGDVKYLTAAGAVLGFTGIWLALFIGCLAALPTIKIKHKYIPFGPFLVAGSFAALAIQYFNLI